MQYINVDVDKLPEVKVSDEIFQNMIVDASTDRIKRMNFHTILRHTKHVISASFDKKIKLIELELNKKKVQVRGRNITDIKAFPIIMQGEGETPWKVQLDYD